MARAFGSSLAISSGVKGGSRICFNGLWAGGSEVIGGAGSGGSMRALRTTTRRDEKCLVS